MNNFIQSVRPTGDNAFGVDWWNKCWQTQNVYLVIQTGGRVNPEVDHSAVDNSTYSLLCKAATNLSKAKSKAREKYRLYNGCNEIFVTLCRVPDKNVWPPSRMV